MNTYIHKAGSERKSEQGNVLFLILIAVALFAALSYAVTQSTRSGGGDASRETSLVNSAQITQYPAGLKTAITRMIISLSVDPTTLEFNPPATLSALTDPSYGVFNPAGGGATYTLAPDNVIESALNASKAWHFNSENEVENIGTNGTTPPEVGSSDIIAFLPGVKKAICERIHTQLGLSTTFDDETGNGIDSTTDMNNANTGIGAGGGVIGTAASPLKGQPQGCFIGDNATTPVTYVYYHVLVER